MVYTKAQYQAANQTDLLEFITSSGVQVRSVGHDSYKGVEHDSLVITPSKNSFYWNSRQVGGKGALDFAKNYLLLDSQLSDKDKVREGMKLVLGSDTGKFAGKEIETQKFNFDKKELSYSFKKANDYLINERKINPKLISQLHKAGLIEQDQHGNALFMMREPSSGKVMGASVQGTKLDHKKYGERGTLKKIEANSTHGYGFNFSVGRPENLYFFEAPIDAMSYYSLHPKLKNARFVSMDGLKKSVYANFYNISEKQLNQQDSSVKSLTFCVDNDQAGTNFMKGLLAKDSAGNILVDSNNHAHYMKLENNHQQEIPINRSSPKKSYGKDWNDVLKKVSENKQEHLKQEANQKRKIVPKKVPISAQTQSWGEAELEI